MSALLEPLLLSDQRCLPINNAERRFEEDSVSFSARQLKLWEALLDVRWVSKDVEVLCRRGETKKGSRSPSLTQDTAGLQCNPTCINLGCN